MSSYHRMLPGLTPDTRPFWTGGASGQLLITQCQDCKRYAHPPLPVCPVCTSRVMRAVPVSGRGRVDTFTVNHQSWLETMPVPFVFAAIELEEQPGLLVMSNIVNCAIETVRIGMAVRVLFEPDQNLFVPLFEPAA